MQTQVAAKHECNMQHNEIVFCSKMKNILIIILLGAFCVPAKAQIMFLHDERGYIIYVDSVYYDSTYVLPTGVMPRKLTKKELKLKAKYEKLQSKTKIKKRPEGVLVPLADRKTFTSLGRGGYGMDYANVFFRGVIVEGADPATFTKVPRQGASWQQSCYFKDKHDVYYLGQVLKGADAETFRYEGVHYAVDKNNVYVGDVALDIDPNEYTLRGDYILGSGKVYYGTNLLVNVNPDSFILLEDGYATDGHKVIYYGKLTNADALTFHKLLSSEGICYSPYRDCFYTDKNRLYLKGEPVEGSGSESKVLGEYHLISNGNVFYRTNIIPEADAGSFLPLNKYWGKDKQSVYYQNKQVESADPATFKLVDKKDGFGFDKEHFFKEGKILLDIYGDSFRHYEENLYVDNNYAYLISYLRVDKIPVDGKTFEEVGRKCGTTIYKDKNRMYEYFDGKLKFKRILKKDK